MYLYAFMETSTIQLGDDDGSRYPSPIHYVLQYYITKESMDDPPGMGHGSMDPWIWGPPKVVILEDPFLTGFGQF